MFNLFKKEKKEDKNLQNLADKKYKIASNKIDVFVRQIEGLEEILIVRKVKKNA